MNPIRVRSKFHFVFFKSKIISSCATGFLFGLLTVLGLDSRLSIIHIINHFLSYIPLGLIFILLIEEIAKKKRYYFYYNQGITKIELWIVSILLSFSFYFVFNIMIYLCRNFLKLTV